MLKRYILRGALLAFWLFSPLFSVQSVLANPESATISGRVVDVNGNGIAGAQVLADDESAANAPVATLANDAGYYTISGALPGASHLQARGGLNTFSHYWNFSVADGGSYSVNLTLRLGGGSISGRVLDSAGNGIAGAVVYAFEKTGQGPAGFDNGAWGATTSDTTGYYMFSTTSAPGPGLPTGTFVVIASKPGLPNILADNVRVTAGLTTANVTLIISSGTAQITGQITNAATGAGLNGAQVYVDSGKVQVSVFTGADGRYAASNLPSGGYNVVVWMNGFATAHRYSIQVLDGQATSNVNFPLTTKMGSISGRVVNGSGGGIAGATILADSLQGSGYSTAIANSNGEYTLTNLAPMQYYVHAEASGYPGFMALVPVSDGQTASAVNITLSPVSGGVSGRVTRDGQPAGNATVWVNSSTGGAQMFYKSGHTDANGYYSLPSLPDGKYDVHVFDVPSYTNQVRYLVEVGESMVGGVDFNLINGSAFVSGFVKNVNGQPVANAQVDIFMLQNPGTWATVFTNSQGYYVAGGLWAGEYNIYAFSQGYPDVLLTQVPIPNEGTRVDLVIGQERTLVSSPSTLNVLAVGDTSTSAILRMGVTSGVLATWNTSSEVDWLLLGSSGDGRTASGNTGTELLLRFDSSKVGFGRSQTTLTFTSSDAKTVTVTVVFVKVQTAEQIYLPVMNR